LQTPGSNQLKDIKILFKQLPQKHRIVISVTGLILLILLLIPSEKATASRQSESALKIGKRYQVSVPNNEKQALEANFEEVATVEKSQSHIETVTDKELNERPVEQLTWRNSKVKRGDSLAKILNRLGYSARTTYEVSQAEGEFTKLLKKLDVGDTLSFGKNQDGKLAAIKYPLSATEILHVHLEGDKYVSNKETKPIETRETTAQGVIRSSFWNAGIEAGLNEAQIINLAGIFGWDIDFALDIRSGDSFHVVFEEQYIDGEYIGPGKILAAEFINQDEPFQEIRFSDGEYYSPNGNSMRKAFLRAPVNFKYISSNFKPRRFHPIQKRWKSHNGTDYRANTGTPVVAAGNGKVTHSTYNKYNGHYVFIQHGNGIVTKYLHFSKRAVRKGQRVKQGDVIGYVGSTGMSEAPHLHYEFLVNGVHRNPRTVKLPDAQPIAKKYKEEFNKLAQLRLNELEGSRRELLAKQSTTSQEAP